MGYQIMISDTCFDEAAYRKIKGSQIGNVFMLH